MKIESVKLIEVITPEEPIDVYDIEMPDDDHCFFANDILVHSS